MRMTSEYKVGAVSSVITPDASKKKKKKKKNKGSDLFKKVTTGVTPIFKPFSMPEVSKDPPPKEITNSQDEPKSEEAMQNEKKESVHDGGKEKSLLFKREKGLKRADDEIQRRKERKIRKKEAKRKLREEETEEIDEMENKKMKFSHQKAGNDPEADERTIFVGNLPITVKRPELKKYFSKIGLIESVRLRSAAISKPDISKKVGVLRQDFHPERTSINGFVVFTTKELAEKALTLNGSVFEGHHIRVDLSNKKSEPDHKHSVFVGNLSFKTEEEELWTTFAECGEISNVRLIRDKETGVGKGFGYVTFKETDSIELALKLVNQEINGRKMRISRSMKRKTKEEKTHDSDHKKFQGVSSKQGLKLKLAKKGKFDKKPAIKKGI
ncbi:RNA-binding protein 34 [Nymphon striatum]|nr:RNA-binding protein 34 [Nymphon striatum]